MKISDMRTDTLVENEQYYRKRKLIKRNFIESFVFLFGFFNDCGGRTSRKDFIPFILIFSFFAFILHGIGLGNVYNIPLILYSIIFFLPLLSNTIRRIHDTGHSGWYLFFPVINIFLLFKKGDIEDNRYGSNPLFE